ncbi:MAG: glycosyl hydrolase 2 galactose-binding domain-containing protein [Acidimicrobiales bacterium]
MDYRPRLANEGRLSGSWRATPRTWELQRIGADAELDDSSWQVLDVPGHWGQVEELAHHDGPILYRRRFDHRRPEPGERLWLRFDGVMSQSEVWLDGDYIGDTSGYFAPQRFEVGQQLDRAEEHLLAVEVSCPNQGGRRDKTSLTGSLQNGRLAPDGNPGGIWRDVWLDSTGPVAVIHSRLLVTEANAERAEVTIRMVLDAAEATDVRIDTSLVGPDGNSAGGGVERHSLASGENRIEWSVTIDTPSLWWPASLGDQPMYEVATAVRLANGELSDRRDWRTGLRRVSVDNFIWRINGQRLFVKGIASGPQHRFLSDVPVETIRGDMQAVRDAGLDMVRIYGHVGAAELYEEADRLGLLIWQDLPMVGGYSSKVRSAARSMARAAVDHLGHHPSVALWCGHCEPNGQALPEPVIEVPPSTASRTSKSQTSKSQTPAPQTPASQTPASQTSSSQTSEPSPPGAADSDKPNDELRSDELRATLEISKRLGRHFLPSWNRSVLDPVVARELRNADRTRPVVPRSGSLPSPSDRADSDSNLWLGWHAGLVEHLPRILRYWPRLAAFLGNIGTQSVALADWDETAPSWTKAERGAFARYLPRTAYADGYSWAQATRAYQADVLRFHIEALRRLKYRPAGGFCITALADIDPAGGYGVLDIDRRPKPAHNVLIDACRPVVVVADPPPSIVVPGMTVTLAVHVISDLSNPIDPVTVTARAHGSDWQHATNWQGVVAADSCEWIGDLVFEVPAKPQRIEIDLELRSSDRTATNRYSTVVIPASEAVR